MYRGLNDNYLVKDPRTKYILRVYRHNWRDLRDIQAETELIQFLRAEGVGVSYPVPDRTGVMIQEIGAPEGLRYAVLFSYAEGQPAASANYHGTEPRCREGTGQDAPGHGKQTFGE